MKLLTLLANAIVAASLAALLSCDKSSRKQNASGDQATSTTSGEPTEGNEQGNLPANMPTITIGQVLGDYLKNANKAQAKYKGKRLRLTGRVLWCNPQPNGKIEVEVIDLQEQLATELMFGRSVAIFDASAMKGLTRGQARFNTEGLALMTEENKDDFQITFDGTITEGKIEEAGEDDEYPSLPEIKIADCILVPEVPSLKKTEQKKLEPDLNSYLAYFDRGNGHSIKGEYDRAIEDYTSAIILDPANPLGYLARGVAYMAKKNYDQAIADFTKTIQRVPKEAKAYDQRAKAYLMKALSTPVNDKSTIKSLRNSAAMDLSKASIELDLNDASVNAHFGLLSLIDGDKAAARIFINNALSKDPKNKDALWLRNALDK